MRQDDVASHSVGSVSSPSAAGRVRVIQRVEVLGYSGPARLMDYKLSDGRRARFDLDMIRKVGLQEALRMNGVEADDRPIPVHQDGREVGTLPALFEPECMRSKSYFYKYRPGDLKREPDGWIAHPSLCPGDLYAIPGFQSDTIPRADPKVEAVGVIAKAASEAARNASEDTQHPQDATTTTRTD